MRIADSKGTPTASFTKLTSGGAFFCFAAEAGKQLF